MYLKGGDINSTRGELKKGPDPPRTKEEEDCRQLRDADHFIKLKYFIQQSYDIQYVLVTKRGTSVLSMY